MNIQLQRNILSQRIIKLLPDDISNIILEYIGHHKCRNGVFIKQLKKNDKRYNNLINIPIIENGMVELYIKSFKRKNYCDVAYQLYYGNKYKIYNNNYLEEEYDEEYNVDDNENEYTLNCVRCTYETDFDHRRYLIEIIRI
jgi:hypothetical protein